MCQAVKQHFIVWKESTGGHSSGQCYSLGTIKLDWDNIKTSFILQSCFSSSCKTLVSFTISRNRVAFVFQRCPNRTDATNEQAHFLGSNTEEEPSSYCTSCTALLPDPQSKETRDKYTPSYKRLHKQSSMHEGKQ